MPFESEAQRKYLYANDPEIAKEFEEKTPEDADLPEYKPMNQGGIAGDWRDELASQLDQQYGDRQDQPQSMADGGLAGNPYDIDMGGTNTVRGLPLVPPSTLPPSMPSPLTFNPRAGLPLAPIAPPLPLASVTSAISPTQARSSVAPTGTDALQSYLSQQKQRLNQYGPDEQMALERSIDKQRRGFLPNAALAGTGLADALMQGVARAGSSNFQANLQNRMDKTQEGQRQAFESGRAGHLARMKQDMEFAQVDPASPLSRSIQRANGKTLELMGYDPEDISMISAASMPDVLAKRLSLEDIRAKQEETRALREQQADFQRASLGLQGQTLEANIADKAAQRIAEGQKERLSAAEALQKRPWYQKAIEIIPRLRSSASEEMLQRLEADPKNSDALDWVNKNMNDPRTPEILKRILGQQ